MIGLKGLIESKIDNTRKYIFRLDDGLITEFSYINKEDGRIIICASTQTGCYMGCKFCYLTGNQLQRIRDLTRFEITEAVMFVEKANRKNKIESDKRLVISYMGIGEPLNNTEEVINASKLLQKEYFSSYSDVVFAVSTIVPNNKIVDLFYIAREFYNNKMQLKFHYSLHTISAIDRITLMPNAERSVELILNILDYINKIYDFDIELHYTLVKGFNDSKNDMIDLYKLKMPIKFLKLAEKENYDGKTVSLDDYKARIAPYFNERSDVKYYEPPGADIGASCGQITFEVYKKKD